LLVGKGGAAVNDKRKWCWLESRDSDSAFGPFASRKAAERAARKSLSQWEPDFESFVVARCDFPDPVTAAVRWAEYFLEPLESMHDNTDEEMQDYNSGDTYDYRGNGDAAKARLVAAIACWAKEYVKATWFNADEDTMVEVRR
jgi:hypothetical protein